MAKTLTSANAVIMLSIGSVFPAPQRLQGFAADDIFDSEQQELAEIAMGVDGRLSAGFVFVPVMQNYSLQADSASNAIFEQWNRAQRVASDIFYASGIIILPSLEQKWTMVKGVLRNFKPIPDAKKKIEPRKFAIVWESAQAASF